jgi:hypothetical protein
MDRICSVGGLIICIVLAVLLWFSYVILSAIALALVVLLAYSIFRNRMLPDIGKWRQSEILIRWLDVLFACLLFSGTVIYFARPLPMERPLWLFIMAALAAGTLATKIYTLPDTRWNRTMTLAEISALGLGLSLSVLSMFPGIVGQDPWVHQNFAIRLSHDWDFANVNAGMPLMSLLSALGLLAGMAYRDTVMFILSPVQIVGDVILVYLIGKELLNSRIGLMSVLVMVVGGWFVFYGYWIIPNTLAMTFALAVAYLFLKAHKTMDWRYASGGIAALVVVVYGHPLPILWLWILLAAFGVSFIVHHYLYQRHVKLPKRAVGFMAGLIVLPLALWSVVSTTRDTIMSGLRQIAAILLPQPAQSVQVAVAKPISSDLSPMAVPAHPADGTPTDLMQNMLDKAHFPEFFLNSAGVLVFFVVAFVGVLYLASKRRGSIYGFTFAAAATCIVLLAALPARIFSGMIFSDRWMYMGQITMAVPLAIALVVAVNGIRQWFLRSALAGLAVAIICFLSIIGLPANTDSRSISQNQIVRYGFSQGELDAARWAWYNRHGTIGIDPQYQYAFFYPDLIGEGSPAGYLERITPYLEKGDFAGCNCSIILIRKEIVDEPFGWGDNRIYKLTYDPALVLAEQGWNEVYDNGEVYGFER